MSIGASCGGCDDRYVAGVEVRGDRFQVGIYHGIDTVTFELPEFLPQNSELIGLGLEGQMLAVASEEAFGGEEFRRQAARY